MGKHAIDRRQFVKTMGTIAGATAVAGCSGDESGDGTGDGSGSGGTSSDGDLGERVPSLACPYWSDVGRAPTCEEQLSVAKPNVENALGVQVELQPKDIATTISEWNNDVRKFPIAYWYMGNTGGRLDPNPIMVRNMITRAGGDGLLNSSHYPSCEFSKLAHDQVSAPSLEERNEMVREGIKIMSEDAAHIPTTNTLNFNAARSAVNTERVGQAGYAKNNPRFHIYSSVEDKDQMVFNADGNTMATSAYPRMDSDSLWNHLVTSTLMEYDENFELQQNMAASLETAREGKRIIVEIKDATFHNGDPVTAEDVQYTFQWNHENGSVVPDHTSIPYRNGADGIKVVDDKTVEFNLKQAYWPFINKKLQKRGIYHKQSFVESGADENPSNFTLNEIIGCGPYQVANFQAGQSVTLDPFPECAAHDPPNQRKVFLSFDSKQAAAQGLQAGEVDVVSQLPTGLFDQMKQADGVQTNVFSGFMGYHFHPHHGVAPTKFLEFRRAWGKALNRKEINQVSQSGQGEPQYHGSHFITTHPSYPDDDSDVYKYTTEPTGEPEAAKQVLEENGWGWDDQGRLHYPPDADLSPLWPKGETPSEEDFPCLSELPED
jgi:peptide/nickel transport system substrate-binding protein